MTTRIFKEYATHDTRKNRIEQTYGAIKISRQASAQFATNKWLIWSK